MAEVFISYDHRDSETADAVVDAMSGLEISKFKYDVDMYPGQPITHKLHEAIETCIVIIVIISLNSRKSEWVYYEIGLAHA